MRGRAFGGRGGLIELLRLLGKVWEAFWRRLRGEEGVRVVVRVRVSFMRVFYVHLCSCAGYSTVRVVYRYYWGQKV